MTVSRSDTSSARPSTEPGSDSFGRSRKQTAEKRLQPTGKRPEAVSRVENDERRLKRESRGYATGGNEEKPRTALFEVEAFEVFVALDVDAVFGDDGDVDAVTRREVTLDCGANRLRSDLSGLVDAQVL